jgi:DNA-directed RNA polymerase specialized sigma24 family protein
MFMTGINPQVFFAIQVVADVVLCVTVVFILNKVNKDLRKRHSFVKTMAELKRLIEESQKATAGLLDAMEESKKALRDVSLSIDEKEARLNRLIAQASSHIDKLDHTSAGLEEALPEKRTDAVIRLAGQGFTPAEIAESLGLSEGEIRLILDLARRRSESR